MIKKVKKENPIDNVIGMLLKKDSKTCSLAKRKLKDRIDKQKEQGPIN